jgi:1,4-dihydroxy-2-naphthoate octaprenyltransferase
MSKTKAWISAMRLRTLPLSISGIILGSFAAFNLGFWNSSIFVLALLTTVFFQVLSNLANDLGDSTKGADNENRVGPQRAVQSGIISKKEMRNAVVLFVLLSIATATPLIILGTKGMPSATLWLYILLSIFCIIAAITYTVGKKAYGYHGMGDIMVYIFFGLVAVLGVFSLFTKDFHYETIFLANVVGFLSMAVLNLNNMRDHENDANVGKKTLVVRMGFKNAKIYQTLLIVFALFSLGLYTVATSFYWTLIAAAPFVLLFAHLLNVFKTQEPKKLDPELKKVALSTFLISILFMITSILWS